MRLRTGALGLLVAVWPACGGDGVSTTGPSDSDAGLSFPTVVPVGSTCGSGASAEYFIWGLSNNVRDPSAKPLESVVAVGTTLQLSLDFEGCGGVRGVNWVSTTPAVGTATQDPRFTFVAQFAAVAPGVTEVFADFEGPDGKVHRTYPAHCPGSRYVCARPRTPFTRVKVVAE